MRQVRVFIVAGILVAGFWLRYQHYDQVPLVGDSMDEYSFSWLGLSLIRLGVPVAAMGVGGYENNIYRYINVDRVFQTGRYASPIKINYPWFDHPPLLGLVTGGYAYMSGARVFEDTSLFIIRKPMVIIGVAAIALVMLLAYEFWGYWPAMLSGIIYATSPLVVVSSRMVQAENLLIIWFMLILLGLKKQNWLLAGIITSLALWTKFSAVVIFPVVFWQILNHNDKSALKKFMWGLMPGIVLLGIYYGVQGFDTFWAVNAANAGREYAIGSMALIELITKQRITHTKFLTDGWILSSWLAFFGTVLVNKKINLLHVFGIAYLAVYILFGNYPHGWYATPFWPVLIIFLGKYIYDGIIEAEKRWQVILVCLIPLGVGINRLWTYPNFANLADAWRWGIFGLLMAVLLFNRIKLLNKVIILTTILLLVAAVVTNAIWVGQLDVSGWYKVY